LPNPARAREEFVADRARIGTRRASLPSRRRVDAVVAPRTSNGTPARRIRGGSSCSETFSPCVSASKLALPTSVNATLNRRGRRLGGAHSDSGRSPSAFTAQILAALRCSASRACPLKSPRGGPSGMVATRSAEATGADQERERSEFFTRQKVVAQFSRASQFYIGTPPEVSRRFPPARRTTTRTWRVSPCAPASPPRTPRVRRRSPAGARRASRVP